MSDDFEYRDADPIHDAIGEGERGKGSNLRERALDFAVRLSFFCDDLATRSFSSRETARQLFRSGSAIGALLEEADGAQSRADFISKCSISLKEARETRYWLRLVERRHQNLDVSKFISECREFVAILTTIVKKSRGE